MEAQNVCLPFDGIGARYPAMPESGPLDVTCLATRRLIKIDNWDEPRAHDDPGDKKKSNRVIRSLAHFMKLHG